MISAYDSALAGMDAATKRIQVSAENIANSDTTSTRVNGATTNQPYIPKDVVQISLEGGGVQTEVRDSVNPVTKLYSPEDDQADEYGFVSYPNVDVAQELVEQHIASYNFKAALKTIQVADNMNQSLLDIFS